MESAWLGNSEDVAKKHYLKVTDGDMASGSLLAASQKAGPNLSLGELSSRLIDRWERMSDEERRAFEFLADWEEELELVNADLNMLEISRHEC